QPLDAVVQLDVATDLLVERIAGRAKAEGRDDDNPESVRKRLQVYNDSTAPVIGFYGNRGTLTRIDGVGTMDEITARILAALKKAWGRGPGPRGGGWGEGRNLWAPDHPDMKNALPPGGAFFFLPAVAPGACGAPRSRASAAR